MITRCIRYTLYPGKLAQFESYARRVPNAALVEPHTGRIPAIQAGGAAGVLD
jgi:hypothetical protein